MTYANAVSEPTVMCKTAYGYRQGAQTDQHHRPSEVHTRGNVLNELDQATRGGTIVSPQAVRSIAQSIISPSRQSRGVVGIQGGWGNERYVIHAEVKTLGINEMNEIFTFYTDGIRVLEGPNGRKFVDPDMKVYLNGRTQLNIDAHYGPQGRSQIIRARKCQTILSNIDIQSSYNYSTERDRACHGLLPSDIFRTMQQVPVNTPAQGGRNAQRSGDNVNFTVGLRNAGQLADRQFDSPADWLSRSMGAYQQALQGAANSLPGSWTAGRAPLLGDAAMACGDTVMDRSQLLSLLDRYTGFSVNGYVTWRELCAHLPGLDENITFYDPDDGISTNYNNTTKGWGGSDLVTSSAHLLTEIVGSVAARHFILQTNLSVTNRTLDGSLHVAVEPNMTVMFNRDASDQVAYSFVQSIRDCVIPEVLLPVAQDFELELNFELAGTTQIRLSMNGSRPEAFAKSTFASQRTTSLVSNDLDSRDASLMDMAGVLEVVNNPI